jgi:hypothetical protein
MYGFRYHLVTVVSFFMALGIGLLLGGSIGQDVFSKQQALLFSKLEEKYATVKEENNRLAKKAEELTKRQKATESALEQIGSRYVEERLLGKKIVLINLDHANIDSLVQILHTAGAEIQGTISVKDPSVFTPGSSSKEFVQAFAMNDNPRNIQVFAQAAETLASELCGETDGHWLDNMVSHGWLERFGTFGTSPDTVIVIGGATRETQGRVRAFDIPLIQTLCKKGVNVIGAERGDAPVSTMDSYAEQGISTVDSVNETAGGVAIVDVINGAKGHFGAKRTADTLLPDVSQKREALR